MNTLERNRRAWNEESAANGPWSRPVWPGVLVVWRECFRILRPGGALLAGFAITGLYEDGWSDEATLLNRFMPTSVATRAVKPASPARRS